MVHALQLQRSRLLERKEQNHCTKLLDECEVEIQSSSSSPKHKLEIKLFSCNPEDPQITWNIDTSCHLYTSHMKALFPQNGNF